MQFIILAVLLLIAAETTYLVTSQSKKSQKRAKQSAPVFVDTSVLIDGRIIAVAQSGFITSTFFIPRSVVGELQYLADNADSEKRARARHGLDVVSELQAMTVADVQLFDDGVSAPEGVDNRLLALAKKHKGAICTIDYNLNKVAQVEGVIVLNVNDLAKTLRMAYLPGEKMMLELTQKGHDSHQAIGHLVDGTMVVVEHASQYISQTIEIEFIRSLQTAAGKMMFARVSTDKLKENAKEQTADTSAAQPRQKPFKAARTPQPRGARKVVKPAEVATDVPTIVNAASTAPVIREQSDVKPPRPQRQVRKGRSRRTPEDSMVELANNADR